MNEPKKDTLDESEFRELVEPYRRALEVHCYRMLGSLQDAEDVVQETLVRAWRSFGSFERRSSVQTWLYRIATNACLDELRRRPRRPLTVEPFPDERLEEAESPVVDPAARYALREGMELAFLTVIQRLPGRQRAVLIFRDVLGWTAPEVASLLGASVASVNSALQRARATLDRELPVSAPESSGSGERDLLRRYVEVWEEADVDGLVELLREDAVLRMPPQPSVFGAAAIARFFGTVPAGGDMTRYLFTPTRANGRPAVVMHHRGDDGTLEPHGIQVLEVEGDEIVALHAFISPELAVLFSRPGSRAA
jgi:RNA polymerase sigma-70 factor (ECF subfamily)